MSRKSGLGRGLDALISTDNAPQTQGVDTIPVSQISPNPHQPRNNYVGEELDQLANSIREYGVIQPLIVTKDPSDEAQYTLIAGERRLKAAKIAGLNVVPVVIREATDQLRLVLALIENLQRADLNPIEEAEAYRQLSEDFGLTHEQIAAGVAKSRPEVSNTLRLLKAAPMVQEALADGKITKGHARALTGLPTWQSQNAALRTVLDRHLNVRQTEELVERLSGQKRLDRVVQAKPPDIAALEERLRSRFGAKVNLREFNQGGAITIRYFSDEELNALLEILIPEE